MIDFSGGEWRHTDDGQCWTWDANNWKYYQARVILLGENVWDVEYYNTNNGDEPTKRTTMTGTLEEAQAFAIAMVRLG